MTKVFAWLSVATLAVIARAPSVAAAPNDPLKPYIVLALDTSGSMDEATTGGTPSCGGPNTKLNHARCAISNIIDSSGDIVIALGRFRMTMSGTTTAATFPAGCATAQASCTTADNQFELLSSLVDGNNAAGSVWTNLTGNTCTATGSDPEIWNATGSTPIEGTLNGTQRYWLGQQASDATTIWPSNLPGFDPIRTDPTNDRFLPTGCDPSATCTVNCCASQCRPYIVIMLSDGNETCGGTPPDAAARMLSSEVDGRRYRIETKAIGFGIEPGDPDIEALAHAGGAIDLPGNEGFYAQDQAGLQLAISQIIEDSIRSESCNGLDDDCDGSVDEDFSPPKGEACDNGRLGVCKRTGVLVCRGDGTGLTCDADPGPVAGNEVCNTADDDCDGKVDEGLTGCTCSPQAEICNDRDDDCDSRTDEGISRQCGTGTCLGVEICEAGEFVGCTAQQPVAETCNGLDDNCDGVRDGFILACSDLPPNGHPPGDPANNPGDPSNLPIPENVCHPGQKTCPANIGPPNQFGACIGERQPGTEICNGLDDDCDNQIDEDTGGADCSTSCGVGTTVCSNGQITCTATISPDDDSCDGNDDDCDGRIDEDFVCANPPDCACTASGQCNAVERCIGGNVVCEGAPVAQESCNCRDDNCNGVIDDGAQCAGGGSCVDCQCAQGCQISEFPCPLGKTCHDNFCITDPCFDVNCPPVAGNKQVCQIIFRPDQLPEGRCVDACTVTSCNAPLICFGPEGDCRPDDCTTFPDRCTAEQNCVAGKCVTNPCLGVDCPDGQYCAGGNCFASCADVDCAAGERCRFGMCETDPCGGPCPPGEACRDETGKCVDDPCEFIDCPLGQFCNPNRNGKCEDDPCVGTTCPDPSQVCRGGTCFDPSLFTPDAGEQHVTTGGGGGCSSGGGGALGLGLAGLLLMFGRRRRAPGGAS